MTDKALCPINLQESIQAYILGRPTGDFLRAVLENDLKGAALRADEHNARHLADILAYVYHEVPAFAWGSPEEVDEHLRACAEARKAAKT